MKEQKWPGGVTAVEKEGVTVTAPTAGEAIGVHEKAEIEALKKRIAELEAMPLLRFIPVEEELPEKPGPYLCQFSDGDIETYPFVEGDGFGRSSADCFKVVGWLDPKTLPSASEQEAMNDYFAARIRYHDAKEKRAYKMNLELAARCDRLRQAGMGLSIELGEQSKALREGEMADVIGAQKEWDAAAKEPNSASLAHIRYETLEEMLIELRDNAPKSVNTDTWNWMFRRIRDRAGVLLNVYKTECQEQEAPSE